MTPSFLIQPTMATPARKRSGLKELAMFGLRKAFIDPAPRPKAVNARMGRYMGDGAQPLDHWLPE